MQSKLKYQTLHAHTTTSDGKMDYLQVLKVCEKNNIGVVAFTDHDTLLNKNTMDLLNKNRDKNVKWVSGIELSSGWPLDLGGGASGNLHLIGLFVDPTNKDLIEHTKKIIAARIERMQSIVGNLKKIGIVASVDDCLKESKGEAVGRPHIIAAINSHLENRKVILKLAENLKLAAKNDSSLDTLYKSLLSEPVERYAYYLFLSDRAYLKGIYVDYTYSKDFDASVKLVRNAGGLVFLAHWFTAKPKISQEYLTSLLKANRLDGVETVCGLWSGDPLPRKLIDADYSVLKEMVAKYKKLESGGCDAHSTADFELFNKNPWYAKRTVGLVQKIIDSGKVDKRFSSFN